MKLFFSDVDNTLLETELKKETIDAIVELTNSKREFVFASGRPLINLLSLSELIKQNGGNINYVCGYNGAQIYDFKAKKLICDDSLSLDDVNKITEKLKELSLDYLLYENTDVLTTNVQSKYAILEADLNDLNIVKLNENISSPKILGFSDPKETDKNIEILSASFPEYMITKSKPFFIEITKAGVTKGSALEKIAKICDVNLSTEVCIFGDSLNDLSMFELDVRYKYAPSNAQDIIKEHATEILDSCENQGVAKKIKEILNK